MYRNQNDVITSFVKKYDYFEYDEVLDIYSQALYTYIDLAYPFDRNMFDVPEDNPRIYQWIYDCMNEIVERNGTSSLTAYSENGMSWTWDSSGISEGLKKRIVPKCGVPK